MKTHTALRLCAAALAAGAISLVVGCEAESAADATITVSPVHVEVTESNPSVTIKASGGWDYIWNLNNSAAGYLDKYTGSSVTYTAVQFGGTNAVEQIISVSGMGGSTNAAAASAKVTIVQQ